MLSGTRVEGAFYLRAAILCFRTHVEHVDIAIDAIRDLNAERLEATGDPEIVARIAAYEMAYRMQSSAPDLIDVSAGQHLTPHMRPLVPNGRIPVIAEAAAARRRETVQLCEALLTRHGVAGPRGEMAALWESLLDFELWHRLVRGHGLPRADVRAHLLSLVLAVTGPQPTNPPRRPTRRSLP